MSAQEKDLLLELVGMALTLFIAGAILGAWLTLWFLDRRIKKAKREES